MGLEVDAEVDAVYLGEDEVDEVYLGDDKVWPPDPE